MRDEDVQNVSCVLSLSFCIDEPLHFIASHFLFSCTFMCCTRMLMILHLFYFMFLLVSLVVSAKTTTQLFSPLSAMNLFSDNMETKTNQQQQKRQAFPFECRTRKQDRRVIIDQQQQIEPPFMLRTRKNNTHTGRRVRHKEWKEVWNGWWNPWMTDDRQGKECTVRETVCLGGSLSLFLDGEEKNMIGGDSVEIVHNQCNSFLSFCENGYNSRKRSCSTEEPLETSSCCTESIPE